MLLDKLTSVLRDVALRIGRLRPQRTLHDEPEQPVSLVSGAGQARDHAPCRAIGVAMLWDISQAWLVWQDVQSMETALKQVQDRDRELLKGSTTGGA